MLPPPPNADNATSFLLLIVLKAEQLFFLQGEKGELGVKVSIVVMSVFKRSFKGVLS